MIRQGDPSEDLSWIMVDYDSVSKAYYETGWGSVTLTPAFMVPA